MKKRILSVLLFALIVSSAATALSACDATDVKSESGIGLTSSLTESTTVSQGNSDIPDIIETADICDDDKEAVSRTIGYFSHELFKRMYSEGENTLVSPFSVYTAFAMLQNGADGITLAEINQVLGGYFCYENMLVDYAYPPVSPDVISEYFKAYTQANTDDKVLQMANSVWCNGDNLANEKFISDSKTYFGADIFNAPFTEQTADDINSWVSSKTNKMIDKLLDEIPINAQMYLIDALAFDGKWSETYEDNDIVEDIFTNSKGQEIKTDFLCSQESLYLDNGNATGFVKPYNCEESNQERYYFMALLPNEGTTLDDYINNFMTDEDFTSIINNAEREEVNVRLPKFDFDCSYDDSIMNVLYDMGIHDAFDEDQADFSRLTNEDFHLYISKVIHKTKITVDEKGTKAAAVTAIEMVENALAMEEEVHTVDLNRPFLFAIYDSFEDIPIFVGALNTVE